MLKGKAGIFMAEHRAKIVLPYVNGRLLDIGCGPNRLVRMYGNGSVGADVRQWGDVDVLLGTSGFLPFAAGSFDTVTIIAALSHIKNRQVLLGEARRVLRPGGRLVLTMIPPLVGRIIHFLAWPLDVEQTREGLAEGEAAGISNVELRQMLHGAGFNIESEKRILGVSTLMVALPIMKDVEK